MFFPLFILFAVLPIIEIALLINIGEQIGGWNTVGLVIITAFAGAYLVRQQGLSTLMTAQNKMQQGQMPEQEMVEGLLLLVAGVLLVTPGFITDIIGFLFCLPFTRPAIAKQLFKRFAVGASSSRQNYAYRQQAQEEDIIEGEFRRTDNTKIDDSDQMPPK